jgi:5-methylcytosine-specific restriction enzyme A
VSRNTGFPPVVQKIIRTRSGGICEIRAGWRIGGCEGSPAVHRHHRRNRGAGGSRRADTNLASNGLDACYNCHEYIGMNPSVAYQKGWLIRQGCAPSSVPIFYRNTEWILLDDDGYTYTIPAPVGGVAS